MVTSSEDANVNIYDTISEKRKEVVSLIKDSLWLTSMDEIAHRHSESKTTWTGE